MCHHTGLSSIPGHPVWDLWWIELHSDMIFSKEFCFPLSVLFYQYSKLMLYLSTMMLLNPSNWRQHYVKHFCLCLSLHTLYLTWNYIWYVPFGMENNISNVCTCSSFLLLYQVLIFSTRFLNLFNVAPEGTLYVYMCMFTVVIYYCSHLSILTFWRLSVNCFI
jgi:hypothetical protein